MPDMYDAFSSDYDRFVSWPGRLNYEMPFLLRQLPAGGSVLDAACGTGMHAIELARHGFSVSGADLSPAMIERARANAASAGQTVHFKAAGFGGLAAAFPERFDALICLGNSIPHLLTQSELHTALADFSASLRPGGVLLLQNRNFDAVLAQRARWMEPQNHREGAAEWIFLRFYDYLPDNLIQFNILTLKRAASEAPWEQTLQSTQLFPWQEADLVKGLEQAGFSQIRRYGDMQGADYNPQNSGNLVITAVKKDS